MQLVVNTTNQLSKMIVNMLNSFIGGSSKDNPHSERVIVVVTLYASLIFFNVEFKLIVAF